MGAAAELLLLLDQIPARWPTDAPRLPPSGQTPAKAIARFLPKSVDVKSMLATGAVGGEALSGLLDAPAGQRAARIDAGILAGELTESHVWMAAYSAVGSSLLMKLPGAGASATVAVLQIAEGAGRRDLMLWGAALAADDLVENLPDPARLDAILDRWLALPVGPREEQPRALLHLQRALRRNARGEHAGALADFEAADRLGRAGGYDMAVAWAGLGVMVTRAAVGDYGGGLDAAFQAGDVAVRVKARLDASASNPGGRVENQLEDLVGTRLGLRWIAAYGTIFDGRAVPPPPRTRGAR